MLINMGGTLFNIPLDYAMINGAWGFPELGIMGAGLATVAAWGFIAISFSILIFTKKNNNKYQVWSNRRFNPELFMRLMKFGIPGGAQFFMEILVFTFFILMVGRLGKKRTCRHQSGSVNQFPVLYAHVWIIHRREHLSGGRPWEGKTPGPQ